MPIMMIGRKLTSGPGESTPNRLARCPSWNTATVIPNVAPIVSTNPSVAFNGTSTDRNASSNSRNDSPITTNRYVGSASDSLFDTSTPTAVLPVTEILASPVASGCTADRRSFTRSAVSSLAGPLFGITCSKRVVPS